MAEVFISKLKTAKKLRRLALGGGGREACHLLCHQTGQGLALRTHAIRGVRSAKIEGGGGVGIYWLVMLSQLNFFFFSAILQSETSFLGF